MTTAPHIIIIDNYDSFVHNLARYAQIAGATTSIIRNDVIDAAAIIAQKPDGIILSPGPKAPKDAGICIELIKQATTASIPLLGVCLGHQAIGEAFGGSTNQAVLPTHGQATSITHTGTSPLFSAIPNPFEGGLYHSLSTDITSAPDLSITATAGDTIMAIQHKSAPLYGIQFHPESILTPQGQKLIQNFINIVKNNNKHKVA